MQETNKAELATLSRMFSATVFRELAAKGRSPLLSRLLRRTRLSSEGDLGRPLRTAFDEAFQILRMLGHRDEYIYRSAIAQKIVIGKHRLNAAMVTELRAGSSKADVVVLNGTATVYEIKSERDSFARLESQIADYRRVFGAVNVITSPGQVDSVRDMIPDDVGLIQLSREYSLQTVREACSQPWRTSPIMLLETLRASEAISLLAGLGVSVPDVPNTQLRGELRRLFADQDPSAVHDQMVEVLRQTRSHRDLNQFVGSVPTSLHASVLAIRPGARDRSTLVGALDQTVATAIAWS